ncbi:MAG TPA: proprotein convertase P-domain-containing protein [Ignavibacteria bacterium]|nr:proprotein convertase P-domain-containing protein [Ignavibacteria bacterium]
MKSKLLLFIILNSSFLILNSEAQMTWNQACSFAGTSSSYAAVPHNSALNITGNFTIAMWVNPDSAASGAQILLQKRAPGNNVGYTLYLSSGRVSIRTNSSTRLIGKTVIPNHQWTHIAGSYSSSSGTFRVFVNGVLDTTSVVAAADPISNTDSLFIGVGSNNPFNGLMDEIQIWSLTFVASDVSLIMRISLGTNTGFYTGLVASYTFQNANPAGTLFSLNDWSGNNLNATNKGVTGVSFANQPCNTISLNEFITLDGTGDYLSGPDNSIVSPVSGITVEAWVYPESFNANTNIFSTIVHKGSSSGAVTDYRMEINLRKFSFIVNETVVFQLSTSGEFFPLNKWSHVAFTYSGTDGFMQFILNGEIRWDDTNFVGNIHDNTDSLYIGGTPSLTGFDGYIDEMRITSTLVPYGTISNQVFTSVNESNDPSSANAVYNFDGGLFSNSDNGPRLNFRGDSRFSHNAFLSNVQVSPMSNSASLNFSRSFYLSNPNSRIPATGTSGFMVSDTIDVPVSETISDLNVFVALNHTDEDNLILSLISPSGTALTMYSTSSLINNSDNIVTIFDDQADSSLLSNRYVMYSPIIKPLNNLNIAFSGTNTSGKWKLRIQDAAAGDTGILIGWGIQFNNQTKRKNILSLASLIQGFYDSTANKMKKDTMRAIVRNSFAPFSILDSSKAVLDSAGHADLVFNNLTDGVPVYIQLKHRNSLETWSKKPSSGIFAILFAAQFSTFTSFLEYDFTNSSTKAFGNNMIQADTGPNKFAIYSGDVDQNGFINLTDVLNIYNDAGIFVTGYKITDINGDNVSDLNDIILANNNSNNFVSSVRP